MHTPKRINRILTALILVTVLAGISPGNGWQRIPTSSAQSTVSPCDDEFNSSTLDPKWSWIREDPSHWSLTERPGYLRITTQQGDVWESTNNLRNLLLQQAPDGDFTITTLVTIDPYIHAQQAGLLVHQDDDNYVRLTRGYMFSDNYVEFTLEQDGSPTALRVPVASRTVYLSISRSGSLYKGHYSVDGVAWTRVGEFGDISLQQPRVGISAWNGNHPAPEIPADFDFFHVTLCDLNKQPVLLVHRWGETENDRLEEDYPGFEKLYRWMQADGYVEGCNLFYATGVKASNNRIFNAIAIQLNLRAAYNTVTALNPDWRGHFDIIGHSYGGLNARFYLESSRYTDDASYGQYGIHVDNLFTLGSPHGGVIVPDEQFPGAILIGLGHLNDEELLSADDLLADKMYRYNRSHSQPEDVCYRIIGGDFMQQPDLQSKAPIIWRLYDGTDIPNDIGVSRRSSLQLGTNPDLASQYGHVVTYANTDMHGYFDHFGLGSVRSYVHPNHTYQEVISPNLGTLASASQASAPTDVRAQAEEVSSPPLLIASEFITGGQTINGIVEVDWSGESVFYAKWMDGDLDLTLSDPTGYVITPTVAAADPNADYDKGALGAVSLATYSMTNTVTGNWAYTVTAPSGPYPILFDLYVIPDSPLVLRTSVTDWHPFGTPVVITASLTYSTTPLSDATVQSHITRPDESESTITLHDDGVAPDDTAGDGIYSATFADTALGGYYYVLTEADGTYAAQAYHRTAQEVFTVASQDAALSGVYSDRPEDTNGDGQYEYLIVDVGVDASQTGDYLVSAILEGLEGQYIDLANASVISASSALTFSLYFSGDTIRESGLDGPYIVTQVLLLDDARLIKLDEANDAWVTALYEHGQFGDLRQLYLPIVLKDY